MSPGKSLKHIFNRAATHAATAVAAVVLALGVGGGVAINSELSHETSPPVASVQMHDGAVTQLRGMAAEILAQQARIDFNAQSLQKAQANLGVNGGKLDEQMKSLQSARDQQTKDEQAQQDRLSEFRKQIWFNPSLSEKNADNLYTELFYAAQEKGMGNITDYFSPMTDALTFRDEIIAKRGLPLEPAKISSQAAQETVLAGRTADKSNDNKELFGGFGAGLGAGALAFSLIVLGHRGRRREEDEARASKAAQQKIERAAEPSPPPPPESKPAPASEPAPPRKFAV